MINRKLQTKEKVYFIHPKLGVCVGRVNAVEEKHVSLKYKENGETEYITMPIEDLSLDYRELESKWDRNRRDCGDSLVMKGSLEPCFQESRHFSDGRFNDKNNMQSYLPTISFRNATCQSAEGTKDLAWDEIPNSYSLSAFETEFLSDIERELAASGISNVTAVANEAADEETDCTHEILLLRDGEQVGQITFEFGSINTSLEEMELYDGTTVADLYAGDGGWARLREMGQAINAEFAAEINGLSEENEPALS